MYAVIEIQGHQYIVEKDSEIIVDRIEHEQGKSFSVDSVLAVFDKDAKAVHVGTPYVSWARVELNVHEHNQWDKLHVIKFKRKNRYQRKIGFRPQQTVLTVKSIKVHE